MEHQIQTLDFHQNVLAHDVTLSKSLLLCGSVSSATQQGGGWGGGGWGGVGRHGLRPFLAL